MDDDKDDFIESHDDLVLGIDNILSFDLEQPLIYTKKDIFFFVFTLLFLLINGYMIIAFIYLIIGLHMSLKFEEEEEDTQESKEWEILENLTYRAFYIYSLKNKKKVKKKSKKYLTVSERLNFCNKCMYKYNNNHYPQKNNESLSDLNKGLITDYNYFLNIYYNMLYYNSIFWLSKYSNNILNISHLKNILLDQYKLDLIKLTKLEQYSFINVNISNYNYFYLNKEIYFTYHSQFIIPNNKIKIFYLIF